MQTSTFRWVAYFWITTGLSVFGQTPPPPTYPTIGKIVRDNPALDQLIPPDAKIEVLASGFKWTEGPLWVKEGGYLLFSDIPNNAVMKWKEGEGISLFMKPAGYT